MHQISSSQSLPKLKYFNFPKIRFKTPNKYDNEYIHLKMILFWILYLVFRGVYTQNVDNNTLNDFFAFKMSISLILLHTSQIIKERLEIENNNDKQQKQSTNYFINSMLFIIFPVTIITVLILKLNKVLKSIDLEYKQKVFLTAIIMLITEIVVINSFLSTPRVENSLLYSIIVATSTVLQILSLYTLVDGDSNKNRKSGA
jgi:hypothetical protein